MSTQTMTIDLPGPGDIESQSTINSPAAVVQKAPATPSALELDELSFGTRYNGPMSPVTTPGASYAKDGTQSPYNPYPTPTTEVYTPFPGAQTPASRAELLASRPPSPRRDEAASLAHSFWYPYMNRYRVASCCIIYMCNGLIDSAAGAVIPYVEKQYDIGYAKVSMIFVAQAIGFIVMAFVVDWILSKLGRARLLMACEVLLLIASLIIVCMPPFPVIAIAYFLFGVGMAINLALNNVFCANLANSTMILGAAHGSYGIGGILGPIIATTMISHGISWSRYFAIPLAIRVVTIAFAGWSFWNYEKEPASRLFEALERTASRRSALEAGQPTKRQRLWQSMKNRSTLLGALFIFSYQGAEVSISGWVISFLISYRKGDPTRVGYVTTGFWAGITVGRFLLPPLCRRISEKRAVYILGVLATIFEIVVWFLPNVIGEAIAVSLVGLVLGPVYPCGSTVFVQLFPRHLQVTSLSFIASAGSSGGAIAPFLTGLLAQKFGTWVLHPICVGLFAVMLTGWFCLPKVQKRDE